jgi:excisionase family DNA binding protein
MSAYASAQIGRSSLSSTFGASRAPFEVATRATHERRRMPFADASGTDLLVLEALVDKLVARVVAAVVEHLDRASNGDSAEWLDSRSAAEYLGVHRDTLRKLAAERAIPVHQDGRGCKLFFRRSDLDEWRDRGGRGVHLATLIADAA